MSRGGRASSRRFVFTLKDCYVNLVKNSFVWEKKCLFCFVFLQKRRDRASESLTNGDTAGRAEASPATEDISVPKDLDLIALPQLCFPGTVGFLKGRFYLFYDLPSLERFQKQKFSPLAFIKPFNISAQCSGVVY